MSDFVAYYSCEGMLNALPSYSPKCVEEWAFSEVELPIYGVLRSSRSTGPAPEMNLGYAGILSGIIPTSS